jgi:hypothetical protein
MSGCVAELIAGRVVGVKDGCSKNQSAIALSKNPVLHDISKHINTKYHFIRECVELGEISLEFVGTQDQLADLLTKPLARVKFQELCGRIGITKLPMSKELN